MTSQTKQKNVWVVVTVFIAIVIFAGCKKGAGEANDLESFRYEITPSEVIADNPSEFAKPETTVKTSAKMSLADVIRSAKTWRPAYIAFYGKTAPDFTLPDIHDEQYKFGDCRGKKVTITFWATWCPGCKQQMQDLIALRNLIGRDKLTILAISFMTRRPPNTTLLVKNFVERSGINYPVISVESNKLPAPYNQITSIPCTFFIDPEGKIKMATEGLMPLSDIKGIIEAEH